MERLRMKPWPNELFSGLKMLFLPPACTLCGRRLVDGERHFCQSCRHIPFTDFWEYPDNPLFARLSAAVRLEAAASFFPYDEGRLKEIIHDIKFRHCKRLGYDMGEWFGKLLAECGPYDRVDLVIPVPLHKRRLRRRGYNQSEVIARGIAEGMGGKAVSPQLLERTVYTRAQSGIENVARRRRNVEGVFRVPDPAALRGKHLLLVDDVITTGATVSECVRTIRAAAPSCRVSVVSLASVADMTEETDNP